MDSMCTARRSSGRSLTWSWSKFPMTSSLMLLQPIWGRNFDGRFSGCSLWPQSKTVKQPSPERVAQNPCPTS